jgi:hypothetical protein
MLSLQIPPLSQLFLGRSTDAQCPLTGYAVAGYSSNGEFSLLDSLDNVK